MKRICYATVLSLRGMGRKVVVRPWNEKDGAIVVVDSRDRFKLIGSAAGGPLFPKAKS